MSLGRRDSIVEGLTLEQMEDMVDDVVSPSTTPPQSPRDGPPDSPRTATRKRHAATFGLAQSDGASFNATSMEKWEHQQYDSFLKWVNYRLDSAGYPSVNDLVDDLRPGVAIVQLLEALSGVTEILNSVHYNPRHPAQRLANLQNGLAFATGRNGLNPRPLRLENIGPEDIHDGNRVLIMGFLWSIILQYQIALFGYDAKEAPEALKRWVNAKSDKKVTNFADDFQDGEVLKNLISNLTHKEYATLDEALDAGESELGVPRMIEPEVLQAYSGDPMEGEIMKKCMMTYVSIFYDKYGSVDEAQALEREEAQAAPPPPPPPPADFWEETPAEPEPAPEPPKPSFPPPIVPPEERLKEGTQVMIPSRPELGPGVVRYLGGTKFKEGTWIGIELISAVGKNDGSVKKVKYFNCKPKHGIFVPPDLVVTLEEAAQQVNDECKALAFVPDRLAHAAKVNMRDFDKKAVFLVEARDQWNRKYPFGGDQVDLVITPPPEGQELKDVEPAAYESLCKPTRVEDNGDGTYLVEYLMLFEGKYILDVFMNGKPISNSRGFSGWTLDAKNRIFYPYLIIHGPGTELYNGLTVGNRGEYFVEIRDTPTGDLVDITSQFTILEGDREALMEEEANMSEKEKKKKKKKGTRILTPAEKRALANPTVSGRIETAVVHSKQTADSADIYVTKADLGKSGVACQYAPMKAGEHSITATLDGKWEAKIQPKVHVNLSSGSIVAGDVVAVDAKHPIVFGFGWNVLDPECTLTAACFAYRHNMYFDYVTTKQSYGLEKALTHNSKGSGSDIEEVVVDLTKVGRKVNNLLFMVRPKKSDVLNMSKVTDLAFIKVSSQQKEGSRTLARFLVNEIGGKAALMGRLSRWRGDQWVFHAVGDPMISRSLDDWTDPEMMSYYLPAPPRRRTFELRVLQMKMDLEGTPGVREELVKGMKPYAQVVYDNESVKTQNAIKKYVSGMAVWLPQHLVRIKGQADHLEVTLMSGQEKSVPIGKVTIPLPDSTKENPCTVAPAWYAMHNVWEVDGIKTGGIVRVAVREDVVEGQVEEKSNEGMVPKKSLEAKEISKTKKQSKKDLNTSSGPKAVKRIFVSVAVENYDMIKDLPVDIDGKVSDLVKVIKGNIGFPVSGYYLFAPSSTKEISTSTTIKSLKLRNGDLLIYKPLRAAIKTMSLAETVAKVNPMNDPNFDMAAYKEQMRLKYEADQKANEELAKQLKAKSALSPRQLDMTEKERYKQQMLEKYEAQQRENQRILEEKRAEQEEHSEASVDRKRRDSAVLDAPVEAAAKKARRPPVMLSNIPKKYKASMDDNLFVSNSPKRRKSRGLIDIPDQTVKDTSPLLPLATPPPPIGHLPSRGKSLRVADVPMDLPPARAAIEDDDSNSGAAPSRQQSLRLADLPTSLPPPRTPSGTLKVSLNDLPAGSLPPPPPSSLSGSGILPPVGVKPPAPTQKGNSLPAAIPPPASSGLPKPAAVGLPPPPSQGLPRSHKSPTKIGTGVALPPPPSVLSPPRARPLPTSAVSPPPSLSAVPLPPSSGLAPLPAKTVSLEAAFLPPPPSLSSSSSAVSLPASVGSGLPPPPACKAPGALLPPPPQASKATPTLSTSGSGLRLPPPPSARKRPVSMVAGSGMAISKAAGLPGAPSAQPPAGLKSPNGLPPPPSLGRPAQRAVSNGQPPEASAVSRSKSSDDTEVSAIPSRVVSNPGKLEASIIGESLEPGQQPKYISVGSSAQPTSTGFSASKRVSKPPGSETKKKHRRNRSLPDKAIKGLMKRGKKDKAVLPPPPAISAPTSAAAPPSVATSPPAKRAMAVAGRVPSAPASTGPKIVSPPTARVPAARPAGVPPPLVGGAARPAARRSTAAPPVLGANARAAQRRSVIRPPAPSVTGLPPPPSVSGLPPPPALAGMPRPKSVSGLPPPPAVKKP